MQSSRFTISNSAISVDLLGFVIGGMLESALSRPMNKWAYGEFDLINLGAAYGFGLCRNHPFVDGNKRTAFLTMMTFLRVNGRPFRPDADEATAVMIDLAAGKSDEDGLANWIRSRSAS